MTITFTPERQAAWQAECDAYNAGNGLALSLVQFVQMVTDARGDGLMRAQGLKSQATPQKVAELSDRVASLEDEKDALEVENADLKAKLAAKDAGALVLPAEL
jgi:hypothetical protein